MAAEFPMYRDRDAEVRDCADRRGLSGEIRLPDAPERQGVEIFAPRRGYSREVREDPRPISRGDQEAKAAGERQPRRGMFDGFKPKPIERPAPGRVQGEKPKRGMFDGLKLDATPATPSPARADRGEDRAFARAVERTSRSAEIGRSEEHKSALPSLMRISYAVF